MVAITAPFCHSRAGGIPAQRALARLTHRLSSWVSSPRGLDTRAELRIDVELRPDELATELDNLYRRLRTPGDPMFGIDSLPANLPGLVFRWREADAEYYVYVEDVVHGCLAGYTVFNRLVELNRRADRHLRAPHSRYAPDYQRRGIATAVYEWALDTGLCLISGARQSTGAHGLWRALARQHELVYVDVRDKSLRCLGTNVGDTVLDDLHTRMVLLGRDWTLARLCDAAGMKALEPSPQLEARLTRPRAPSTAAATSR